MRKKPIFIHSMFRTGSTYLWNKFRSKDTYYCYYEPLHHVLSKITPNNIESMMTRDFNAVHHPKLDKYYLQEYLPLLIPNQTGVPNFKKGFSYDQFCMNDENPGLKLYIDSLLDYPKDKTPVLKFNRTAFRIGWFKKFYPDVFNIYLVREPRDQWQSYIELHKRTKYLEFFLMDLLSISANHDKDDFLPLSRNIPLLRYENPDPEKEFIFYQAALESYSDEERYYIFYYIWFNALIKNVLNADLTININLLAQESSYKKEIGEFFQKMGINDVDFQDAKIETYPSYSLPVKTIEEIENNVKAQALQSISKTQTEQFFQKLALPNTSYFHFDKKAFARLKKKKIILTPDIREKEIEKLKVAISRFIDEFTEQKEEMSHLERRLQETLHSLASQPVEIDVSLKNTIKKTVKKSSKKLSRLYNKSVDAIFHRIFSNTHKINLGNQVEINYGRHRSGLKYGLHYLKKIHNPNGINLDAFIERTFCWRAEGIKAHMAPWVGFIHVPPNIPDWFIYEQSNEMIFESEAWKKSLPYCKGLFTLSGYHRKYLETKLDIPINNLIFPTETPDLKWDWERFDANKEKKIIQVGWWLRKLHGIYQLPETRYKKIFLNVEHQLLPHLMNIERKILINEKAFDDKMYRTAEIIGFLPDEEYDRLLCENIVFVYLYDASANNTVIECIARNTPILINPIEPVKEYLGEDYPFYYNSFEEAVIKVMDFDLVNKTHLFLKNHPIKARLTGEYFLKSFVESSIYGAL